jgi:hypothetical protein
MVLDPTPNQVFPLLKCPCCTNWFRSIDGFAEFCSEACARTAQRYASEGEWRRCRDCRREFLALEKPWRRCQSCYQAAHPSTGEN